MPKNKIVSKNTRPGSNKATGRDYSYDKDYQASPSRVKYREDLNKEGDGFKSQEGWQPCIREGESEPIP